MAHIANAGEAFQALADLHRRAIVEQLATDERSVRELADALPISRPAVSRHLRVLKDAGLVEDRADGTRRLYSLQPAGVEAAREYLEDLWTQATARFRLMAENTSPPEAGK